MAHAKPAVPAFILLLLLGGFAAMFTASFHSFMDRPENAKPASSGGRPASSTTGAAPGDITSLPDGGPNLALTEQQADGVTNLMRRLQSDPNDVEALLEIGDIFIAAKEWARAEVFLNRAMLSRPSDIRPRYMLGICSYQQGKMREAAASFEELLTLEEDPAAMFNLAVIYKYHRDDMREEAEALLRRVVASPEADMDTISRAEKELSDKADEPS